MLLHDVSQTALAGAVLTLGLVMLLEIRSFARLRRMVDINLSRVFEQHDQAEGKHGASQCRLRNIM